MIVKELFHVFWKGRGTRMFLDFSSRSVTGVVPSSRIENDLILNGPANIPDVKSRVAPLKMIAAMRLKYS